MLLSAAYILYRFFKRFPVAMVLVLLSQSCFATSIEKEIEENANELELYIDVLNDDKQEPSLTKESSQIRLESYSSLFQPLIYQNEFCKSVYYNLYILYLNIAIDKRLVKSNC